MTQAIVPGETTSFVCHRCDTYGFHLWSELTVSARLPNSRITVGLRDEGGNFEVNGTEVWRAGQGDDESLWRASLCAACNESSVWRGHTLIYPRESSLPGPHSDMPSAARTLYEEARGCFPVSQRAAAALARAALEKLLREAVPDSGSKKLDELIAGLASTIRPGLWKTLTAVRVLGNDSLHGNDGDLVAVLLGDESVELVAPLFMAINALVEELITQPRVTDEIYTMIPVEKREAAERKAGL
ncbi:DUF4145 domain-containing protein [Microbacterium sp. NPDC016588]